MPMALAEQQPGGCFAAGPGAAEGADGSLGEACARLEDEVRD